MKTKNSLLLLLTAFIWGMAFVSQSKGMDYMHPLTFNGIRALIGAATLGVYIFFSRRKQRKTAEERATVKGAAEEKAAAKGAAAEKPAAKETAAEKTGAGKKFEETKKTDWAVTLQAGIWCGLALTAASTLQQFGIKYTSVGKAGFITTLYIIFVPLAGILFKKKVSGVVWAGALMAALGMYLLCMTESFVPGAGDILVFLSALVFAAHIMIVDHFSPKTDGVQVSCIQFIICGVVCTAGAFLWESPDPGQIREGLGALLYAGVLSCGVAYTLQILGQKGVNPTVAALILSLESVFATVAGWIAYEIGFLKTDQTLTGRQIGGCILVFAAVILVQLPDRWFRRKRVQESRE